MRRNTRILAAPFAFGVRILIAWLILIVSAGIGAAADIHVMISGGLRAAYNALVPQFERETGHKLITVNGASMGDTPTAIPARLARNEPADVVILARSGLDALLRAGEVKPGSETDLARSPIGVAVKKGAPVPKIATTEELRQALLNARSIAYSDSASGVYVSGELFKKLGIEAQVRTKAHQIDGTPVAETVARGEAEIGFQQMSELIPVAGVTVVGPIPEDVQHITIFSAGIPISASQSAAAHELINYLASPKAWDALRKSGVEPIERTK